MIEKSKQEQVVNKENRGEDPASNLEGRYESDRIARAKWEEMRQKQEKVETKIDSLGGEEGVKNEWEKLDEEDKSKIMNNIKEKVGAFLKNVKSHLPHLPSLASLEQYEPDYTNTTQNTERVKDFAYSRAMGFSTGMALGFSLNEEIKRTEATMAKGKKYQ